MNDNITVSGAEKILRILAIVAVLLIGLLGLFMSLCGGAFLFSGLFLHDGSQAFWPISTVCTGIGVALVWLCGKNLWRRWSERRAAAKAAR